MLLWILAGIGLLAIWSERDYRPSALFIVCFLVFSFLAVCPGFLFRSHYFIVMLPAVALLAGAAVSWIEKLVARRTSAPRLAQAMALLTIFVALAGTAWQQRAILFELGPLEVCKTIYSSNPFVESAEIARYIAGHTEPGERIAVIGSEPQMYFYSGRHSATGYIYMYPLMEEHPFALNMQKEMINEIESARPIYLIVVATPLSWLRRDKSHDLILRWMNVYASQSFDLVGVVEFRPDGTSYDWDEHASLANRQLLNSALPFAYRRRQRGLRAK